ncbi:HlyD family type I secretion periplasmic adaptor subunit [Mangrovicella endophytica]|uniref:HlyD family type I secretion periplasmic adaptor subunit n=1 Tax=Mangrovicella endophytica TaxID=2066697 RepID=UPI000C9E31FB|nr:HlyD family type I secretion periplasmic adaptor subunit [Mangrovicella endophytica]
MSLVTLSNPSLARWLPPSVETATLSHPVLVDETAPQIFIRRASTITAIGIFGFIVWAALADVHEVSQAGGMIVPEGFERVVQHYEGGIVKSILVHPGDLVEQGAPLFILDDAGTAQDLDVVNRQQSSLSAQMEGLEALAEGRDANFAALAPSQAAKDSELAYQARRDAQDSQQQLFEGEIQQARLLISTYDIQMKGLENDRAFAASNFARIETLISKGYATATQLAERRKVQQDVENQILLLKEKKNAAVENLNQTQQRLNAFLTSSKFTVAAQVQELRGSLTIIGGDLDKKQRRQDRLTVKAPVRGIVKSVEVTTLGGIVGSGQVLATIVPTDEPLHAETRIAVSQIGYIEVGMPAHVKVTAFDFTRFGWLDGHVAEISPSSFGSEREQPFYTVRIDFDNERLPFAPAAKLMPGMAVSADIITGSKSVLAYFLSPIRKALDTAFEER